MKDIYFLNFGKKLNISDEFDNNGPVYGEKRHKNTNHARFSYDDFYCNFICLSSTRPNIFLPITPTGKSFMISGECDVL